MAIVDKDLLKKLKKETGLGMNECKAALESLDNDYDGALHALEERAREKAEKLAGAEASEGVIASYVHHDRRIGSMVELNCQTDFAARSEEFLAFADELALQIAATNPKDIIELQMQESMFQSGKIIEYCRIELSAKIKENVVIKRIHRFALSE